MRSAATASASDSPIDSSVTLVAKTTVTQIEFRYSELWNRSWKLARPTKLVRKPKASCRRNDCQMACPAGQIKKIPVIASCGNSRA